MTPIADNLLTLLVVEDEKNTRDGLRRYFDGKFDIYLAPDVAAAMNDARDRSRSMSSSPTCA